MRKRKRLGHADAAHHVEYAEHASAGGANERQVGAGQEFVRGRCVAGRDVLQNELVHAAHCSIVTLRRRLPDRIGLQEEEIVSLDHLVTGIGLGANARPFGSA
jgi:hypothetical protein